MNIFRKTAIALALAAGALGSAQADVLAQNVLQLTNLRFLNADTTIVSTTQLNSFSATDSSDHTASLNGTTIATSLGPLPPAASFDLAQVCVGTCVFAENNFSQRPAPATINVARSDSLLTGSPVAGLGIATGANASTVAEAQLIAGGVGSAQTNMGLLAEFNFILGQQGAITIAFDAINYLIAHLGAGETGSAQASSSWVISVSTGGATVFRWTPDGAAGGITGGTENSDPCALNNSIAALSPNTITASCNNSYSATTNALLANTLYTLNIRHASASDVAQVAVPEPGSLALAGLGVLLMAGVYRRRNPR